MGALPGGSGGPAPREVVLVDVPLARVRRQGDVLGLVLALAAMAVVVVLVVFAAGTSEAVTRDVRSAVGAVVRSVLLVPVTFLEGLLTFVVPLAVVVAALVRGAYRSALQIVLSAVVATAAAQGLLRVLELAVPVSMSSYVAGLAGLLTVAGDGGRHRLLRWSWTLLWVVVGLSVFQGQQSLPGALLAVLLGRAVGLASRLALGVRHDRATGAELVAGIRQAGADPVAVVRVGAQAPRTWRIGPTDLPGARPDDGDDPAGPDGSSATPEAARPTAAESAAAELPTDGTSRVYAVEEIDGRRSEVLVFDEDRQVAGYLSGIWDALRIRGLTSQPVLAYDAPERAALLMLLAGRAGVRTPALVGTARRRESVLIVTEHVPGLRPLSDVAENEVDDALLDGVWHEVRQAHAAGLVHRDLDAGAVRVDGRGRVWLCGWARGELGATDLARRVDLAQTLVLLAVVAGSDRAVSSAARALPPGELAAVAPLLQGLVLPDRTRRALRSRRPLVGRLREALAPHVAESGVRPVEIDRFSVRTVLTVVLGAVALWVLLASLRSEDVATAVAGADPLWMVVAFLLGMSTYVGAAATLVALSPERLGMWRTLLVHTAASVVVLVVPAGIGPAAVNLRFLRRRDVPAPVAVATVGLAQLVQFLTTVVLLLATALLTGSLGTLDVPSPAVLGTILAASLAVALVLTVPRARTWVWTRARPALAQVWPRVIWLSGHPLRLAVSLAGGVVLSAGYIAAFGASLAAFGHTLPLTTLAITYLAASAAGSIVPSPGGVGPVELALTAGLAVAGVPYGVALSCAVLFRVLTFWVPVPIGWLALRHLRRVGDL